MLPVVWLLAAVVLHNLLSFRWVSVIAMRVLAIYKNYVGVPRSEDSASLPLAGVGCLHGRSYIRRSVIWMAMRSGSQYGPSGVYVLEWRNFTLFTLLATGQKTSHRVRYFFII